MDKENEFALRYINEQESFTVDEFYDVMWQLLNVLPMSEWDKRFDEKSKLIRGDC